MKMQGYNGSQCWDTTFAVQVRVSCLFCVCVVGWWGNVQCWSSRSPRSVCGLACTVLQEVGRHAIF